MSANKYIVLWLVIGLIFTLPIYSLLYLILQEIKRNH